MLTKCTEQILEFRTKFGRNTQTDKQTDRQTDRTVYRVASQLKNIQCFQSVVKIIKNQQINSVKGNIPSMEWAICRPGKNVQPYWHPAGIFPLKMYFPLQKKQALKAVLVFLNSFKATFLSKKGQNWPTLNKVSLKMAERIHIWSKWR